MRLYDLKSEKADQGIKPLHRLCSFKREESKKMKLMTLYVWHKPHDPPLFVPATPGSVLHAEAGPGGCRQAPGEDEDAAESYRDCGLGRKLTSVLVNLDLTLCWRDDCDLCECEARGGPKGGQGLHLSQVRGNGCA